MGRYVPENSVDQAAAAVEGEIRQFVRQGSEKDAAAGESAENLSLRIQRVTAASMKEIDRIVLQLQDVREVLLSQGEHVRQDVSSYASLNYAAMAAMKVIGENLKQWRQTR